MNKIIYLIPFALALTGCVKTIPQAYMPEPPEILMRAPRDLNTIIPVDSKEDKEEVPDEKVQ